MSHFNLKSLTFYTVAIVSVVGLFEVVTAYGESNLKPPPSIGGFYSLKIATLPDCSMGLALQQSGIYLHGVLVKDGNNISPEALAEEQPSLSGRWQDGKVSLAGVVPIVDTCPARKANDSATIDAAFKDDTLNGRIQFNPTSDNALDFIGRRERNAQPSKLEH